MVPVYSCFFVHNHFWQLHCICCQWFDALLYVCCTLLTNCLASLVLLVLILVSVFVLCVCVCKLTLGCVCLWLRCVFTPHGVFYCLCVGADRMCDACQHTQGDER